MERRKKKIERQIEAGRLLVPTENASTIVAKAPNIGINPNQQPTLVANSTAIFSFFEGILSAAVVSIHQFFVEIRMFKIHIEHIPQGL